MSAEDSYLKGPDSTVEGTPDNDEAIRILTARQNEYKAAALAAKRMGDKETAIAHIRVVKVSNALLTARYSRLCFKVDPFFL